MTSPLGRYAGTDPGADPGTEPVHEVRLLGAPVRVWAAGRDHHDDVLRELALLALSQERGGLPARLGALVSDLGERYGAATARPTVEIDEALAAGVDTVDLTFHVPSGVVAGADELEALMDEADAFCASEQLLTVRRSNTVRAFSAWYLDELRRQVAGEPPRPWTGPLDP